MNEFEAAFYYGDFSSLRKLTNLLLTENAEGILTPEEFRELENLQPTTQE